MLQLLGIIGFDRYAKYNLTNMYSSQGKMIYGVTISGVKVEQKWNYPNLPVGSLASKDGPRSEVQQTLEPWSAGLCNYGLHESNTWMIIHVIH